MRTIPRSIIAALNLPRRASASGAGATYCLSIRSITTMRQGSVVEVPPCARWSFRTRAPRAASGRRLSRRIMSSSIAPTSRKVTRSQYGSAGGARGERRVSGDTRGKMIKTPITITNEFRPSTPNHPLGTPPGLGTTTRTESVLAAAADTAQVRHFQPTRRDPMHTRRRRQIAIGHLFTALVSILSAREHPDTKTRTARQAWRTIGGVLLDLAAIDIAVRETAPMTVTGTAAGRVACPSLGPRASRSTRDACSSWCRRK